MKTRGNSASRVAMVLVVFSAAALTFGGVNLSCSGGETACAQDCPVGARGEQGDRGDAGAKGDPGDPGAKGDKGDPGNPAMTKYVISTPGDVESVGNLAVGFNVTAQTLDLPNAGTWLVFYTAEGFRNLGTRGDLSRVRLTTATAGSSGRRGFAGVNSNTTQSHGTVTIVHTFTTPGADTVTVEISDDFGGVLSLKEAQFVAVRLGA